MAPTWYGRGDRIRNWDQVIYLDTGAVSAKASTKTNTNSESGKQVSGNFSFIEKWYAGDTWDEAIRHGLEIRITVPGSGVVFLQTGTVEYFVPRDGDIRIEFSAGPKDWNDEEYGMLCAALAD